MTHDLHNLNELKMTAIPPYAIYRWYRHRYVYIL